MFARLPTSLASPRGTIIFTLLLIISTLGTIPGVPPASLGGHAGEDASALGRVLAGPSRVAAREVKLALVVLADGSLRPLPRDADDLTWDQLAPLVEGSAREITLSARRAPRLSGLVGLSRASDDVRIDATAPRGTIPGPFGAAELSADARERLLHIFADHVRSLADHQRAPELRSLAERVRAGGAPTIRWTGLAHEAIFWLSLLGALLSLGWLSPTSAFNARRNLSRGLCPRCRYDLKDLPAPRTCPECGSTWP
ncbi:MAG: hypothetical protein SFY95_04050 [Planctomycetota bacterium]|nr:hypothetical protein [Planctomycetota bacterium]